MSRTATLAERRSAADQLGVPPDAPSSDARTAFLRKLPAAGFLPTPPLCAAATVFTDRPVPGATGAIADPENDEPRGAVLAFAREFWSLPPKTRRYEWQKLLDRTTGDPLLAARVRQLEAGVDLADATRDSGPPRPREVVGMIQTLFVLSPFERAARRRELLDALPPPVAGWEQAARHVQQHYGAHAALEPALVDRLSTWGRRPKAAARGVARPAATWGFQTQGGLTVPQVKRPKQRASGRGMSGWLAAFLVFSLIRACGGLVTGPPTSPQRTPVYVPPSVTLPADWKPKKGLEFDAKTGRFVERNWPADNARELQPATPPAPSGRPP